ncbi:MAG: VTT domain-containing protein [Myxococcaceae bacterium]|nr:VTT domain-containing protein [Myxococcaceae bacterium]
MNKWLRAALPLVVMASLALSAHLLGLTQGWTLGGVRSQVESAGALGVLVFFGLFAAGELVQVPGFIFVGAALLAWGPLPGFFAALTGALFSVSVSFFVVRCLGGRPLGELKRPFLKKLLARLEARPVLTVALLRLLLWVSPPLNYALALSPIRYSSYLLGSALGLLPPLAAAALLVGPLFGGASG